MDEAYMDKKIVDLSDDELVNLGFLGPNVAPGIKRLVEKVKANPVHLGNVTCFMLDVTKRKYAAQAQPPASPISPTVIEAETLTSELSINSAAPTVVAPDLISQFERKFYYHGVSSNPPKLMWRSNLETNPFPSPIPPPGAHFYKIPTKTAFGVFNTRLNEVWDDSVAPQILASMKAHGLKYSALKTARFLTVEDGGHESFGPIVVWIAVRPNTTNAEAVRDATPDILHILANVQITDAVVEWYEGSVVSLGGPALMRVEHRSSAKFGLNHPFNTGLGIPISGQSDDMQGTLTLLFREMQTSSGDPSDKILGLTNKHVVSVDTTTDYDFSGVDPQHILVCGHRRFDRAVSEIRDAVNTGLLETVSLAEQVADLELKLGTPKEDRLALKRNKNVLKDMDEDNANLKTLLTQVNSDWQDPNGRRFGVVDWAPQISVRVDDCPYTRDIATFVVDAEKLENFDANIVDSRRPIHVPSACKIVLAHRCVRDGRRIPANLQLPVRAVVPRRLLVNPDTEDQNGRTSVQCRQVMAAPPSLPWVATSGMDAYICTDLGLESREVVVYNYSKTSGDFSNHGDSGSLIFSGDGNALAILHSGMRMHNHVSYGTPLWWVIKQILTKYPSAEFYGMTYNLD